MCFSSMMGPSRTFVHTNCITNVKTVALNEFLTSNFMAGCKPTEMLGIYNNLVLDNL